MNIENQDIQLLKQRELEFLHLVENCNRNELVKCAKFLAMYLALYRQQFGEIPFAEYNRLLQPSALDDKLIQVIGEGLQEASEMMKVILLQGLEQQGGNAGNWIN